MKQNKKQLLAAVKELKQENADLTSTNKELIEQRDSLAKEVERLENHEDTLHEVFTALGENLKKSFKAKNIINMNEEELNAMYCMAERFNNLCVELDKRNLDKQKPFNPWLPPFMPRL